jgi:hypothetical protein
MLVEFVKFTQEVGASILVQFSAHNRDIMTILDQLAENVGTKGGLTNNSNSHFAKNYRC